ncbi:MAG: GNAT family N-acetyltransferase [Christensenellales bacterium]|jgi:hypothetical protein
MSGKLSVEAIHGTTLRYYSHFCGIDLTERKTGLHFVCTLERDEVLKGFGCKYTLFLLIRDDLAVISCAPKHRDFLDSIRALDIRAILSAAEKRYALTKKRLFVFGGETVREYGATRILTPADYPFYEAFFREMHPNADPSGWLHEYFSYKSKGGLFSGCFRDSRLVSVCDAPDMPYMEGEIQHTGIATLESERRKGYAKYAAALSAHHLIESGICPQWECDAENIASIRLAQSVGYEEYALAYILEEGH